MTSIRRIRQPPRDRWVLLAIVGLTALPAVAQPTPQPAADQAWGVHLTANESTLWLAQVGPERSLVYRRGVNDAFEACEALNGTIARLVAARGALYAFVEEGRCYALTGDTWSRARDLPGRTLPVDLTGGTGGPHALILSPPPGQLPRAIEVDSRPSATRPFDPGDAPLSVVRYERAGWIGVASCPTFLTVDAPPRVGPRLSVVQEVLHLFWRSTDGQTIEHAVLAPGTGDWRTGSATPPFRDLVGFWITTVSRVPTLIAAVRAAEGGEQLRAFRLLGGAGGSDAEWRPAPLQLSGLPDGVRAARYEAAFGFNQHAVLLMVAEGGVLYLRFGRIEAAAAEPTVAVLDVFEARQRSQQGPLWLRTATPVVLFGVVAALFLLRRGAMVRAVELPAGYAPAMTFQRLIGCVIDLVPFGLAAALISGADWRAGLRELFGWAYGSDAVSGRLPPTTTLLWWGLTVGGYTVYSLVMELLTRRTVGKVLTGTRLLSESGRPPSISQTTLRNLSRILEMLPPLWILGFLVVLSRNRQRVGDIFARTIVTRQIKIEKAD